jgi:hypothetical protein
VEIVDVVNHPGGRERLHALGVRHIPLLARGSEYVMGQVIADVAKFVGVRDYRETKLPPDVLMQKWLTVLSAGQRYIGQFPAERLGRRVIETRDQSTLHMGYHVFRIGHAFLATAEQGVKDWASVSMEMPPAAVQSGADVAAYGETIKERLREWWKAQPDKSCSTTVTTYTGTQPLRDFLERQTWHSAQHVRQLAAVLEGMGIEPAGRLTADDLAGLPLPKALWE